MSWRRCATGPAGERVTETHPWRRRRLLLALVVMAVLGLALVVFWRTVPLRLGWQPTPQTLFIRCDEVAGLQAGAPVRVGERPVGTVSDLTLLAGGVLVTCRLAPFPELTMPVRAVISDAGDGQRLVLLTGSAGDGPRLRPDDVLPGSSDINLPGELAPLRLP